MMPDASVLASVEKKPTTKRHIDGLSTAKAPIFHHALL